MARIVLGLGTSHSPQLSAPADAWPAFGENDKRNPELLGRDGKVHPYDEFLAQAGPSIRSQLTPEVWQSKWERCQKGVAWVGQRLAEVAPDDDLKRDGIELPKDLPKTASRLTPKDEAWCGVPPAKSPLLAKKAVTARVKL